MRTLEENPPEGESSTVITHARRAYRYQREWVAVGGIQAGQVRWARQIRIDGTGHIEDIQDYENWRREDRDTHANDGVYSRLGTHLHHRAGTRAFILNSTVDFLHGHAVSLAFCPMDNDQVQQERRKILESQDECDKPTVIPLDKKQPEVSELYEVASIYLTFLGNK